MKNLEKSGVLFFNKTGNVIFTTQFIVSVKIDNKFLNKITLPCNAPDKVLKIWSIIASYVSNKDDLYECANFISNNEINRETKPVKNQVRHDDLVKFVEANDLVLGSSLCVHSAKWKVQDDVSYCGHSILTTSKNKDVSFVFSVLQDLMCIYDIESIMAVFDEACLFTVGHKLVGGLRSEIRAKNI